MRDVDIGHGRDHRGDPGQHAGGDQPPGVALGPPPDLAIALVAAVGAASERRHDVPNDDHDHHEDHRDHEHRHVRRQRTATRISNRIRVLRFHHGEMTQQQLAAQVGVTRQTINAVEVGVLTARRDGDGLRVVAGLLAAHRPYVTPFSEPWRYAAVRLTR